jgi:hypothetical protein
VYSECYETEEEALAAAESCEAEEDATPIALCFVRTDSGDYFVQVPDPDSRWGFYLADDDQTWDGGFGIASSWEAVKEEDLPADVRERFGSLEDW